MAAPVSAPYVPSYASYTPYLTPDEYLAEPTGVDVSQLLPGIPAQSSQKAVLTRVIGRASSWADQICHKILAATLDVQSGEYRVHSDGTIRVPVDNTPLIQVTDVKVGQVAGRLAALGDLSGCRVGKKVVRIPVTGGGASGAFAAGGACARPGWLFADTTYVNGYAHTLTATGSAIGATSIQVKNPLGIFPGLPLTVYDGAANGTNTEQVFVDSSYVSGTTIPLASPAMFGHGAGVSVSALPGFVREAVISLTSCLIKTRGTDSFVMPMGPGQAEHSVDKLPGAGEDYDIALALLEPLRRVW